jgi:hypothetical protein
MPTTALVPVPTTEPVPAAVPAAVPVPVLAAVPVPVLAAVPAAVPVPVKAPRKAKKTVPEAPHEDKENQRPLNKRQAAGLANKEEEKAHYKKAGCSFGEE